MPSPFIGGRIPQDLHDALQRHIAESGEKLPQILQRALSSYLNYTSVAEQNQMGLEERVATLEVLVEELREAIKHPQQPPTSEEQTVPEQLSILNTDNSLDIETVIREEADINAEISNENTANNADIDNDINKPETITPQEMAERTGIKIGSLRNYMSTGREVRRNGFLYTPISSKKRGQSVWRVDSIPDENR